MPTASKVLLITLIAVRVSNVREVVGVIKLCFPPTSVPACELVYMLGTVRRPDVVTLDSVLQYIILKPVHHLLKHSHTN